MALIWMRYMSQVEKAIFPFSMTHGKMCGYQMLNLERLEQFLTSPTAVTLVSTNIGS